MSPTIHVWVYIFFILVWILWQKSTVLKLYDNFLLFTYIKVVWENIWLSHGVLTSLSFLLSYDLHVEPNIFLCSLPTQWMCTIYIFLLLLQLLYVKKLKRQWRLGSLVHVVDDEKQRLSYFCILFWFVHLCDCHI